MGRCSSSASTYRNEACPATPAARRPRAPLGARPKVVLSRRSVPTFCPDRVADRAQRPQRPPEGSSARARRPLGARPKVCARRSQRRRPGSESRPSGHCSSSERHIGAPGPSSPPATTVSSSRRGPGGSFATRARVPRHRERKNQRHRNGGNAPRRHCVTGEVRCRVASSRRRSRLPPPAHVGSRRMLAATGRGPVQVRDSVGSRQNYLRAGADGRRRTRGGVPCADHARADRARPPRRDSEGDTDGCRYPFVFFLRSYTSASNAPGVGMAAISNRSRCAIAAMMLASSQASPRSCKPTGRPSCMPTGVCPDG